MNFFQRVRLAFNESALEDYVKRFLSGGDIGPSDINVDSAIALKFTAVFGCCRVLAETLASLPVSEYTKDPKNDDRTVTNETGVADLFRYRPNDEMDALPFKEMGMYQVNLGGNFVCTREYRRDGRIYALNPIEWNRVKIERDPATKFIRYKIDGGMGDGKEYGRDQVFHVLGPTFTGISGLSPIEYAAQAIRLGLTYETFSNNFFKNGVLPTGIFGHPGTLKEEAYNRLREQLRERYSGLANSGKPILTEDGLTFTSIPIKLLDAELLASKRFQVEDICRIYRVPLHLVQNLERATFSNIEQQSLEFVMYTMLPWVKRWEGAINGQLLTQDDHKAGRYIEFNLAGLLRGDSKSMAEAFAIGRQWGWLCVNDIRRLLNMNGIGSAGDIYLQPMNMIEAGEELDPEKRTDTLEKKQIVDEVLKLIEERKK